MIDSAHIPLLVWNRDSAENGCGTVAAAADVVTVATVDEAGGKGVANNGGGNDECDDGVDECIDNDGGGNGIPDAIEPGGIDGGGVGFVIVFVTTAGDNCALLALFKNENKHRLA